MSKFEENIVPRGINNDWDDNEPKMRFSYQILSNPVFSQTLW